MIFGSPFMRPFQAISGGQGGAQVPIFAAPLITNRNPSIGTVTPSFTRTTSGTYFDGTDLQTAGSGVDRFPPEGYLAEKLATNQLFPSEPTVAQLAQSSNVGDSSESWLNYFSNQISFGDNSVLRLAYLSSVYSPSTDYTVSVYVKMDDDSTPVVGSSTTGDFSMVLFGSIATSFNIKHMYGNIYRVCATKNSGASSNLTFGVAKFTGQSSKPFKIIGYQLELGKYCTSYIPTTISAVTRNRDQLDYDNTGGLALPTEFTIVMDVTPKADGADYLFSDFRFLGSNDSRGSTYELRTVKDSTYNYSAQAGGGFYTLNENDFSKDILTKIAFTSSQEGANSRATIWKNGAEKHNLTQAQTLDHSNSELNIGHYSGSAGAFSIKNVIVYQGKLSDSKLAYLTSL